MANDVLQYLDDQGLQSAFVLGHSMGGKVMMQLALDYPNRVAALVVADIAPVTYPPHHNAILEGLAAIKLGEIASRQAADAALSTFEPNVGVRQFLLKNLRRRETETDDPATPPYEWRLNVHAIVSGYELLAEAPGLFTAIQWPNSFYQGRRFSLYSRKSIRKQSTPCFLQLRFGSCQVPATGCMLKNRTCSAVS